MSFESAAAPLTDVCVALAQGAFPLTRKQLDAEIAAIANQRYENSVKVVLLAAVLLKAFGEDIVRAALALMAPAA